MSTVTQQPGFEVEWSAPIPGGTLEKLSNGTVRALSLMTLERAHEINGQCVRVAAECGGLVPPLPSGPAKLPDVSLEEMLLAARIVSAEDDATRGRPGPREIHVVCDPRIIAAVYAFEHYESDPRRLLEALGFSARPAV